MPALSWVAERDDFMLVDKWRSGIGEVCTYTQAQTIMTDQRTMFSV